MNPLFYDGQATKVVDRLGDAIKKHPVTVEDLIKGAEFLAACTSYGLNVTDVLMNGIRNYPHLMEMMGEAWDTRPAPEGLGEATDG